MGRRVLSTFAVAALLTGLVASPVTAETTTGTWAQYPTGATEYRADIQPPINTNNTSNWSAKSKGAVPVQFKLSSRTGAAVFESIGSDANTDNDYAIAQFRPSPAITFAQVTTLKTDYSFDLGNCHGGSLRWQVDTAIGNLFIYYGDHPNFTDCTTNSQSSLNMIGLSDLRYDTAQIPGGTQYDTYEHALELIGDESVLAANLIIDSGWGGDQRLTISNTTVNDNVYQWDAGGSGDFAPTCDLPAATIQVTKVDPTVDGNINEEPVQGSLADSGNAFRVVDCKYQYILSIPSLKGAGTYSVEIKIGGVTVPTPNSAGGKVKFDLK